MATAIASNLSMEQRWTLAQEQYSGKIRTFARNSYYKMPGFDVEDVEQELLVVLYECVQNYDPDKGAKFNTYFQQSAKYKIISLIRYFEAKKRIANSMTVTLDDDAVRWAVEELQRGTTAEDIALDRMQIQELIDEHGIDYVMDPPQRRRRRSKKAKA